jgi:hypothetical protein
MRPAPLASSSPVRAGAHDEAAARGLEFAHEPGGRHDHDRRRWTMEALVELERGEPESSWSERGMGDGETIPT